MRNLLFATAMLPALAGTAAAQSVLTYHNSNLRHGNFTVPGLTQAAAASLVLDSGFTGTISGGVMAQPLLYQPGGTAPPVIIAVTETNKVYALNANTGAVVWSQTGLPAAATLNQFPCGDISPEGITGTPVIDPANKTLYFDALVSSGPKHLIYALSLTDGSIKPGWPVDVAAGLSALGVTFNNLAQSQRGALLLFKGALYVPYGGKAGDCSTYHGSVVELPLAKKAITAIWSTTANAGGIWSQSSLAADGTSIYASTGNTQGASVWSGGEAIIRLKTGLANPSAATDYYAPANWQTLDNADLDLGGTGAMPLSVISAGTKTVPRLIEFGKDGNAYLLNAANLGGIGGEINITPASNAQIKTAPVTYTVNGVTMVAFVSTSGVKCSGTNVTAMAVAASGTAPLTTSWCAGFSANTVAPIVTNSGAGADPIVWVVGAEGDNKLHGFNGATGAAIVTSAAMSGLHHFQTLIAANNRLYVGADNRIYAFTYTP